MLELDNIYNGDCLELMKEIPDGSVEVWRTISLNKHYEVSNFGNIRRKEYSAVHKNGVKHIYKSRLCNYIVGKTCVTVSINGRAISVAKLVADAFLCSSEKRRIVYHKNGNFLDNRVSNLSYSKETILFDKDDELSEKEYLSKYYDISNNGVVTRKSDGKVLKGAIGPKGYIYIRLKSPNFSINKDKRKNYKIHRLVAMFYLSDYSELLQVNHKNGIKTDNRVENLEMVTNKQNVLHAWRILDSSERRKKISESNRRDRERIQSMIESARIANSKKVAKVSCDGVVIETYLSQTEAAKVNNVSINAIRQSIKLGGKCVGYNWKLI